VKLLVIGATGVIGSAVVQAGLHAGHDVTVLVRSPEKLGDLAPRLRVVVGDVTDAEAVARAVAEQDAIISALGSSPDRAQLEVPATAARHVLAAMERHGVRRFVGLARGAVKVAGERKPISRRIASTIVRLLARNVVDAKQREYEVVSASSLDWTMVRPPRVVEGPATGRVEIGTELHGFRLTSGDLVSAMVDLAGSSSWMREAPYLSERPA
jgi:putative NADH-flavin reductase